MSLPKWADALGAALAAERLPNDYRERFMEELLDHCSDLMEENPLMDSSMLTARLGAPDALAAQAAHEIRRRTLGGRRPAVTFIVAPIPVVLATLAAVILALAALIEILDLLPKSWLNGSGGAFVETLALETFCWAVRFVPFGLAAFGFCRAARRSCVAWQWPAAACALVACVAAAWAVDYRLPYGIPGNGMLTMGLNFPPRGATQWLQGLAPVAIAIWQIGRAQCSRKLAIG